MIIGVIALVACLGCALCICCWKFETIYVYFEDKRCRKRSTPKLKNVESKSRDYNHERTSMKDITIDYSDDENDHHHKSTKRSKYHRAQNSQTLSQSGGHALTDEDQRTASTKHTHMNTNTTTESIELHSKYHREHDNSNAHSGQNTDGTEGDRHRSTYRHGTQNKYRDTENTITMTTTNTNQANDEYQPYGHTRNATGSIDTSRERMPSSWYRYKEQKQQGSMDFTNTNSNILSPTNMANLMSPTDATTMTETQDDTLASSTVTPLRSMVSPQSHNEHKSAANMALSPSRSPDETPTPQPTAVGNNKKKRSSSDRSHRSKRDRKHKDKHTRNDKENMDMNILSSPSSKNKRPQKQNKKRKKSAQIKKRKSKSRNKKQSREYQKITVKELKSPSNTPQPKEMKGDDNMGRYRVSNNIDDDSESSSTSSNEDTDTGTDTTSGTESDSSSTVVTDTTEDSETDSNDDKDGDNAEETQQTVNVKYRVHCIPNLFIFTLTEFAPLCVAHIICNTVICVQFLFYFCVWVGFMYKVNLIKHKYYHIKTIIGMFKILNRWMICW